MARFPLLLALVLLALRPAAAEPCRLGLSAPLSGAGAGWGNDVKNVLIFANEKLAEGRCAFVFEDDRCDPKTSLSAAHRLTEGERLRAVFVVCGQAVIASAPRYRRAGVTVMAPLATPSRISQLGAFRTGLNDAFAAGKLAERIAADHRSVSVLTEENDYPVGFLNDFTRAAEGVKLSVANENYQPAQQDFRPQLLRLKARNVKALFLNTQTEEALAALVKQLKELGFAPQLYGAYLPGSAGFLRLAGVPAEGLVFVDFPGASELLTPEGQALYAEYLKRFGPLQGWSFTFPAAFEGFRAVHAAIESGRPLDEYLKNNKFDGIFGRYSFDAQGDVVGPHHVLRVIKNGAAETLQAP